MPVDGCLEILFDVVVPWKVFDHRTDDFFPLELCTACCLTARLKLFQYIEQHTVVFLPPWFEFAPSPFAVAKCMEI